MSPEDLLYPAIFIFSMMVIGLVFTVIEFTKLQEKSDKRELEAQAERHAKEHSDKLSSQDK